MSENNNFIEFGDYLNNYLNEANIQCFDKCIKDFKTNSLQKDEQDCINSCFQKYFVSYANVAEMMNLRNTEFK